MAKKKPSGGKHTTPRKPIQFPADWMAVAKRIAAQQKMPVTWMLVELLKVRAETLGYTDLPPVPWDTTPTE